MVKEQNQELAGVWTALVSPFQAGGELDYSAFSELIRRQMLAGVKGVVLCGTTGESPTLTVTEKLALIKRTKALVGEQLSIMVGCGSNNTLETVEFSQLCVDAGAQALMVVTPPYNKPSLRGLIAHYQEICDHNPGVPVVVYHVPGRTGHKLSTAELSELMKACAGLVAIKEASGNPIEFARYQTVTTAKVPHRHISWLSGDDHGFLASLAMGGHGVISVAANVFPQAMVKLYSAFGVGDHATALAYHQVLFPFMDQLFCEVNPVPVKAVLAHMGVIPSAYMRPPLATLTPSFKDGLVSSYTTTAQQLEQLLAAGDGP